MQIFILDNERALAETIATTLKYHGLEVRAFTRPSQALAAIDECDVLVTDYNMPEMTGLEVAWRAYDQGWRGSLLLMSGHVSAIREPIEHPLLRFILDKPFSTQSLLVSLALPGNAVSEPGSSLEDG